ncbi:hypothetical protein [Tenacibaculum halocynthiae]|uniref:hypothetical protein n=1 Tax=Tenacibaculum halocynthiae TaxID=1254437 RepID=UPI003893AC90
MAGKNIKYIFFTIILLNIISCSKKEENIDNIVTSYIKKELKQLKNNNAIVYVNNPSTDKNLQVYRIALYTNLIDERKTVLPNRVFLDHGVKVAFFTKKLKTVKERDSIKKILKENFYYKKDSFLSNSNYPEWVIISKGNNQLIEKDMWYHPIDSIIKRHKNEIEKWDN